MNNYTFMQKGVRDAKGFMLGASDFPVICKPVGSKVQKTQAELYYEKLKLKEGFQGNDATKWGHWLEPLILSEHIERHGTVEEAYKFRLDALKYEKKRPKKYLPPTKFLPYTEAREKDFPWILAHADLLNAEDEYLCEAKSGKMFARMRSDVSDGFSKDDFTACGVPADILIQVQVQLMCYDIDKAYVNLLVDDNVYYEYKVPAMRAWWPKLLEKADRFKWHVDNKRVPKPEKASDVFDIWGEVEDTIKYVTGLEALMFTKMKDDIKNLGKMSKIIDSKVKDIKDAAAIMMKENKYMFNAETGQKLFTQVSFEKAPANIGLKKVKEVFPDIYDKIIADEMVKSSKVRYVI